MDSDLIQQHSKMATPTSTIQQPQWQQQS